jgi:hypothetical protein
VAAFMCEIMFSLARLGIKLKEFLGQPDKLLSLIDQYSKQKIMPFFPWETAEPALEGRTVETQ